MTAAPIDRQYPVHALGAERERLLEDYRFFLRTLTNPATGLPYTDVEIAIATAPKSEAWGKANALDAVLYVNQQRGLWLAGQVRPESASTEALKQFHGDLWGESFLPAAGGSGTVSAPAVALTTFPGSTTLGDPAAAQATDPSQKRYQVLFTTQSPADGTPALLTLAGVDTGPETNLEIGTKLTWVNPPLGAIGKASVTADFTGGIAAETNAQFAARLIRNNIRHKQGAGNRTQIRAWGERASNSVESLFVYACALHAGSVVVAPTQKRGSTRGPTGRIPNAATLALLTAYLAPPGSPVMPTPPRLVVVPVVGEASHLTMMLSMPLASTAGWADLTPWPGAVGGVGAYISAVNVGGNPLAIQVTSLTAPPASVDPAIMVWNDAISRFERLVVASISLFAGNVYSVTLAGAPTKVLAVNDVISPWTERADADADVLGTTIEAYFDSLGPGDVIDTSTSSSDSRRGRAYRFPKINEEYPMRAGTSVLSYLADALGPSLADSSLPTISVSTPTLPTDVILGPRMLVAGRIGVYSF